MRPRKDDRIAVVTRRGLEQPQTHFLVKGGYESLVSEASRFVSGQFSIDEHMEKSIQVVNKYYEDNMKIPWWDRVVIPWLELLDRKDKDSSPGEPWVTKFSTFGELRSAVGDDDLIQFLDDVEDMVLMGALDEVQFTFYMHSKEEKVSFKKILSGAYRSIQGCDFVMQLLTERYLYGVSRAIKKTIPFVLAGMTEYEWTTKLANVVRALPTIATDISGFDKGQWSSIIYRFFEFLGKNSMIPKKILEVLKFYTAKGYLVFPDGALYLKDGGGPSGHRLTSEMNNWIHHVMAVDVYSLILGCEPVELLDRLKVLVVGDDELTAGSISDLDRIIDGIGLITDRWGYDVKMERMLGGSAVFPPGLHGPFLDCTTAWVDGVAIQVPVRVSRRVGSMFYPHPAFREVLRGICISMKGWFTMRHCGRSFPVALNDLDKLASEFGMEPHNDRYYASLAGISYEAGKVVIKSSL